MLYWMSPQIVWGLESPMKKRIFSHLSVAEAFHHSIDVLEILDLMVSFMLQLSQVSNKPKSPLFIVRYLSWWKRIFDLCWTLAFRLVQPSNLRQVSQIQAGCWSGVFLNNSGKYPYFPAGWLEKTPEKSWVPGQDLTSQTCLTSSKVSFLKVGLAAPWYAIPNRV